MVGTVPVQIRLRVRGPNLITAPLGYNQESGIYNNEHEESKNDSGQFLGRKGGNS